VPIHNASLSRPHPSAHLIGAPAGLFQGRVVTDEVAKLVVVDCPQTFDGEGPGSVSPCVHASYLLPLKLMAHLPRERLAGQGIGEHRGELGLLLLDQGVGDVVIELGGRGSGTSGHGGSLAGLWSGVGRFSACPGGPRSPGAPC
jgi:hypothetical protein